MYPSVLGPSYCGSCGNILSLIWVFSLHLDICGSCGNILNLILVFLLHLDIRGSCGNINLIWVFSLHLDIRGSRGNIIFLIWVFSLHLDIHGSCGNILNLIWVFSLHLDIRFVCILMTSLQTKNIKLSAYSNSCRSLNLFRFTLIGRVNQRQTKARFCLQNLVPRNKRF